ncbi:MAG: hypothetical protein JXO22_18275 [Phycisphaerae bacterium]|nr:hypothetical protein [Phycisphaerae bacterium]
MFTKLSNKLQRWAMVGMLGGAMLSVGPAQSGCREVGRGLDQIIEGVEELSAFEEEYVDTSPGYEYDSYGYEESMWLWY